MTAAIIISVTFNTLDIYLMETKYYFLMKI